jgi:hypothetical protein
MFVLDNKLDSPSVFTTLYNDNICDDYRVNTTSLISELEHGNIKSGSIDEQIPCSFSMPDLKANTAGAFSYQCNIDGCVIKPNYYQTYFIRDGVSHVPEMHVLTSYDRSVVSGYCIAIPYCSKSILVVGTKGYKS